MTRPEAGKSSLPSRESTEKRSRPMDDLGAYREGLNETIATLSTNKQTNT